MTEVLLVSAERAVETESEIDHKVQTRLVTKTMTD